MDDNLLILDEPTDGFSKEQMYQLKYVFDGLNASQVIIVSHEKEWKVLWSVHAGSLRREIVPG